jgi:hypothetical protein
VNKAGEVIGSGLSFEKDPVKLGYFRSSALRKVGRSNPRVLAMEWPESAPQYLPSLLLSAQGDAICHRP